MTRPSGNRLPHAAPELVAAVMSRDLSLVSWLVSAIPALSFSHIDPADPSLGDKARHVSVILLDYACLGDDGSVLRRLRSMRPVLVLVPGSDRRQTEIFPLLRRICSEEQLREMGEKVEASKKTAPTHPHPSTPDNPVGVKVMVAAAGVADRARDAARK